jgi:hypothetical protein
MDWQTFIRIAHVIGTVLGVGATTFAEIFYLKFLKDGEIDPFENATLKVFYQFIRLGLVILVFSGLGYLIMWRQKLLGPEVFFSDRFLVKITIILILLAAAFAMNFRLINLRVGSAITLVSWYAALVLGIWRKIPYSYFVIISFYVIIVIAAYFVLQFLRNKAGTKHK